MSIQPQEYEDLLEKLFDDRLLDDELQRLNDVLRQSPEAREHYWHLVMLEGYLADLPGWIAGEQYATQLAFSETLEAFIEMEENAEAQLQSYPLETETLTESQPVTWTDIRKASLFCLQSAARQKAVWGVAAAAMICLMALIYATWFAGRPAQPASEPIAELNQDVPQVVPRPVQSAPVAVVVHQFEQGSGNTENTLQPGTTLMQGRVIALQPGNVMQLEYKSGASVILHGPGTYELLSPERVGMTQGRITALVPPEAKGFTVSTEQTNFIDHGTEFAVALNNAGFGEVLVFDGLIEARPANAQSRPSPEQAQGLMLHKGIGGRLVPGEALPKAVQPIDTEQAQTYARSWDDVIYRPHLSGDITYVTSPPASLNVGQASSTLPLLIPELRGVTLTEDLHLNSNKANRSIIQKLGAQTDPEQDYVIAAGTKLNSFLIHFDISEQDAKGVVERRFKLKFSGRIVGILEVQNYQQKTDALFGLASMQYPADGLLRGASDPPGHPNYDNISVSNDLRTLSVKMRLTGMDQIRVLVENTDP